MASEAVSTAALGDTFVAVTRPTRAVAGEHIVTGTARYTTDIYPPDCLAAVMLHTAAAPARIRAIDVARAAALPGVITVLTAADIPGPNSFELYDTDQPLLIAVGDCARYQGDALAVVVAEDEAVARGALDLIEVEYEPLPGVFDPLRAIEDGAQQVWPDRPNVYDRLHIERGEVDRAFAASDVVIERIYRTQTMEQAFLEPEGALAVPGLRDDITVYAGCQAPHRDRRQIARSLALPENRVRVVVPYVGGAFGGKDETHVQIHAALAAQVTGRPVRLIRTREESLLTHVKRHPITVRYKTGATRDGRLTAIAVEGFGDGGPYANMTQQVMEVFAIHASGPYYLPNARIDAWSVLTNNPACGAMRGFGMPQAHFACEQQIDHVALALKMDPVEVRRINAIESGAKFATGVTAIDARGMRESLDEVAGMVGWDARQAADRAPAPHLRRGYGIASAFQGYLLGPKVRDDAASVTVELHVDGTVTLRVGIVDYGQGSHTVLAQITAENLGVDTADVRVIGPDTDKTLEAGSACSSRVTFVCGHAVLRATQSIRDGLLETGAELTGQPQSALVLAGGKLTAAETAITLQMSDLARASRRAGHPLSATGFYAAAHEYPPGIFDDETFDNPCAYYTFGATAVTVLVDIETGDFEVERMCLVIDAGRILNPPAALGQAEGGSLQGFGYATMEELQIEGGRARNLSLESYLIPTSQDVPDTEVRFLDTEDKYGPYGARGMAEIPVVPTAPAIANAIRDAVSADCDNLPMTAERVLEAMEQSMAGLPA